MRTYRALYRIRIARIALWSSSFAFLAMTGLMAQTKHAQPQTSKPASSTASPDEDAESGQRKFQANCSRCHDAPEQFSPRIAGTIVRHMRVRASLSEKDAQEILRFLAP